MKETNNGNKPQNKERHRQAFRDPTAKAAIGNILREERQAKRQKRKKQ